MPPSTNSTRASAARRSTSRAPTRPATAAACTSPSTTSPTPRRRSNVIPADAGMHGASQRDATRFGVHLPATAFVAVAMEKHFAVYVMASRRRGTLYIGVTSNLLKRVREHRDAVIDGSTRQDAATKLRGFEMHHN